MSQNLSEDLAVFCFNQDVFADVVVWWPKVQPHDGRIGENDFG